MEAAPPPSHSDDLLNFSIGDSPGGSEGYSTPAVGRARPLSATSASWVEEMNAELAEFDALTGGLRNDAAALPSSGGGVPAWQQHELDAALQAQLASPGAMPSR